MQDGFIFSDTIANNIAVGEDYAYFLEVARASFLQNRQSYENARLAIDNQQIGILQLEQTVFDLQQQQGEQEKTLKLAVQTAYEQLAAQIKSWEQTYLLIALVNGVVSFTKYQQMNQNINAGEVLVTVVPREKTKIVGRITLPPQGAGKVKTGQGAKAYILEVEFPEKLVTNYGKTLAFTQEMTGTAEIITEDLRLIDKFLNPIREVIKR